MLLVLVGRRCWERSRKQEKVRGKECYGGKTLAVGFEGWLRGQSLTSMVKAHIQ